MFKAKREKAAKFSTPDRYAQHTQANDHTEKVYLKKAEKLVSLLVVLNARCIRLSVGKVIRRGGTENKWKPDFV